MQRQKEGMRQMDEVYIYDDSLYHFGRSKKDGAPIGSGRYPLGSGKDTRKQMNKISKSTKKTRRLINKSKSEISDEELDKMIERLKKENELNDLLLKNDPAYKASTEGKNAVKSTSGSIGKKVFSTVAATALTGLSLYAIGSAVSKISPGAGEAAATGKVKGFTDTSKKG